VALGGALRLAAVWLSPPVLLAVGPSLLTDGSRGLWPLLVLAGGAVLVVTVLAAPWIRLPPTAVTVVDLARHRFGDEPALRLLVLASAGSALLFLWAELAAGRELAETAGWSPPGTIGVAAIALALFAWREDVARTVAAIGGGLVLVGLVVPLGIVLFATGPAWPRVWTEVASRSRAVFSGDGIWVREGRALWGPGAELTVEVKEEQRVTLLGPGHVRVMLWEGGGWSRAVTEPLEVTLRPGDRVVVPRGFPVRFQAGRPIPGAPSGLDWLEPPGRRTDWRALAGLGVTVLVGALGLAPVHAALPAGRPTGDRAAGLAALFVTLGLVAAMAWSLYAAWLVPEIYTGGIAGSEIYELPTSVPALGGLGMALRYATLFGLAGGGAAAALATLAAVRRDLDGGNRQGRGHGLATTAAALATTGLLAVFLPASPWRLFEAALGLAAAGGAPAAILACWRERLSPRALALGAGVGVVVYGMLTLVALAGLDAPPGTRWLRWLAAWPALVAMPVNAAVVWLLSSAPRPSRRSPLPPGFADLHD
jgi:hypothetical protein